MGSVRSSSAMPAALLFLLAAAVGGTVQVAHAVEEVPQPCLYPHDALQSRGGMRAADPAAPLCGRRGLTAGVAVRAPFAAG